MLEVQGDLRRFVSASTDADAILGLGRNAWQRLVALSGALRPIRVGERPATVRLERVLAVGRAFVATTLTVVYSHPAYPVPLSVVGYTLLASYALYSLVLLALIHRSTLLRDTPGQTIHAIDLLWIASLAFSHGGPATSFLVTHLFVVLAAGYRWGFLGTLLTTAASLAIIVSDAALYRLALAAPASAASDDAALVIVSLLLAGSLVGYLAGQGARARAELATLADVVQRPRVRLGVGGSVAEVARVLAGMFEARTVLFVLEDVQARETMLWTLDGPALAGARPARPVHLDTPERNAWLFPDPGTAWFLVAGAGRALVRADLARGGASPLLRTAVELPARVAALVGDASLIVANLGHANEWRGRAYLVAPGRRGHIGDALRFLEEVARQVTAPLTNVLLLTRLRARVTSAERQRFAREIHDGAIQSLISLEMQVAATRRRPGVHQSSLDNDLDRIQEELRTQVLELRGLMQALRPIPADVHEQLPDVLGAIAERFRHDSGISTRFLHTGEPVALRAEQALELVRITQEALVNTRRHSGARNAMVCLTTTATACTLVVADDGRGLEFEGTFSGPELDVRGLGPAIIRERARLAGAQLTLESRPGAGLRIELHLDLT